MNNSIRIDRDKLFEEIWTEPMRKVSKRYEISDVGLAKACRRMQVPLPPRGYWARIAAGQKIAKPALIAGAFPVNPKAVWRLISGPVAIPGRAKSFPVSKD